MKLEQARGYLRDYIAAGGTDDPGLIEAVQTVCGTQDAPTFILLAKDRLAPAAIRNWINALGALHPNSKTLAQAQDVVLRITRYQRKNGSKIPD